MAIRSAAVQDVDRAAMVARLAQQIRPEAYARERLLPVIPAFAELLPGGGLQRGWTITTSGAASVTLAAALAVQASVDGGWTALVGLGELNVAALGDLGVALERTMFLKSPHPGQWADAVLAAAEGADIVLARADSAATAADARRVQARLAARGSVIILVGAALLAADRFQPELSVSTVGTPHWEGIGAGYGRLMARRVTLEIAGRRIPRPLRDDVWLPGLDGMVRRVDHEPLRSLRDPAPRSQAAS